jgi:uncharacterized YigZ family protein
LNSYKTISGPVYSDVLKIKKSKFIGIAYPVKTEQEVSDALKQIKAEYSSASHYCYAYKLGVAQIYTRTNDDGEPSNSAGQPILGQIKAFDLTDIMVLVLRYYGGTKLGMGGLISAYRQSAQLVLSQANIIEKELTRSIELRFKYAQLNKVMRLLKRYDLSISSQQMDLDCQLTIQVPRRLIEEVMQGYESIYGVSARVL